MKEKYLSNASQYPVQLQNFKSTAQTFHCAQIKQITGGAKLLNNDFREDLEQHVDFPLEVLASGFPGVSPVGPPCLLFSLREDIFAREITRVKGLQMPLTQPGFPLCLAAQLSCLPPKTSNLRRM